MVSVPDQTCILSRNLVSRMICHNPAERLTAKDILKHPFFWSKERQLQFFQVQTSIYRHTDM